MAERAPATLRPYGERMEIIVSVGLTVVVGLVLLLAGYSVIRISIALVGALIGFFLGAGLVAGATDGGILASVGAWVAGTVGALVVGWIAFAFYQVAVLVALGAMGFALGAGLARAMGATDWLPTAVGVGLAIVLVIIGIVGKLPSLLLILATAFSGAESLLAAVMLALGVVKLDDFQNSGGSVAVEHGVWWSLGVVALGIFGAVFQLRVRRRAEVAAASHSRAAGSSAAGA